MKKAKTERHKRYTLAEVRKDRKMTQVQVARAARMQQNDVSVLERRDDVRMTSLVRFARALGGRIETTLVLGNERYLLNLPR